MITHVVIFWVDGSEEKRAKLLEGTAMLSEIPGVLEFRYGPPVPSERDIVDDSFGVAISMTFTDQVAADTYQNHPIHQKFHREYFSPLVSKAVVYDFG